MFSFSDFVSVSLHACLTFDATQSLIHYVPTTNKLCCIEKRHKIIALLLAFSSCGALFQMLLFPFPVFRLEIISHRSKDLCCGFCLFVSNCLKETALWCAFQVKAKLMKLKPISLTRQVLSLWVLDFVVYILVGEEKEGNLKRVYLEGSSLN